jgi:predicted RNA binding protein YcfA (HicA-like mRNA interferase family)
MRRSKSGWRARDLEHLYAGFGFHTRSRGPHVVYFHPDYPQLQATVTRSSGSLPPGYVATALDLLDELDKILADARENQS